MLPITQTNMARTDKRYFASRKEVLETAKQRNESVFKVTYGRHKGQYFVGSQLEFFSYVY